MALRKAEIAAFARFKDAMHGKLKENDHKHWGDCAPGYLMQRLWEEVAELQEAVVTKGVTPTEICGEAADVANFAMMIADVCGGLKNE